MYGRKFIIRDFYSVAAFILTQDTGRVQEHCQVLSERFFMVADKICGTIFGN